MQFVLKTTENDTVILNCFLFSIFIKNEAINYVLWKFIFLLLRCVKYIYKFLKIAAKFHNFSNTEISLIERKMIFIMHSFFSGFFVLGPLNIKIMTRKQIFNIMQQQKLTKHYRNYTCLKIEFSNFANKFYFDKWIPRSILVFFLIKYKERD